MFLYLGTPSLVWDLVRGYISHDFLIPPLVVQRKEDLSEVPGGSSKGLCLQADSWPMSLAHTNGESVRLVEKAYVR